MGEIGRMKNVLKRSGIFILKKELLNLLDNTIDLKCVIYLLVTFALYLIYVIIFYISMKYYLHMFPAFLLVFENLVYDYARKFFSPPGMKPLVYCSYYQVA